MKYHYAWVEVTGKIFVSEKEMEDRLMEKFPNRARDIDQEENDDISPLEKCTLEEEKEVFLELAERKIAEIFPDDTVIKLEETSIDMNTYR